MSANMPDEHPSHNISDTLFTCYGCGAPVGDPRLKAPCPTPDAVGRMAMQIDKQLDSVEINKPLEGIKFIPTDVEVGQRWRHKKSGGIYEIVATDAMIQNYMNEYLEKEVWIAYRNVEGRRLFFRTRDEFLDGRFELFQTGVGTWFHDKDQPNVAYIGCNVEAIFDSHSIVLRCKDGGAVRIDHGGPMILSGALAEWRGYR